MKFKTKEYTADLIIVGAGLPGMCAAIQAARLNLTVALINDRGVLGGNASCEIAVPSNGSNDGGIFNINSREGGICSEILLEYKYRSPINRNRYIMDGVFIDIVNREKNIKVFLNTCIDEVETNNNEIVFVEGTQNTTETRWRFIGTYFVDNTGDGTLGYLAKADFMLGRESKKTFDEKIAPDKADKYVNPSTLMFWANDVGYEIPYVAPDFALDVSKADILKRRIIPNDEFHMFQWYYEIGGEYDHVNDKEEIIAAHKALIYGIWDYIKNSGLYQDAKTYDFSYVGCIPGTREYRRLVGDYILSEIDIFKQIQHKDFVGHGGWNIDLHAVHGFFDKDFENIAIQLPGIYKIPYRTLYSKNINNLFLCGRCMSTSHVAFGSTRVISTLSVLGQAIGCASYLCKNHKLTPREIYSKNYYSKLQQLLLKEDQLLVGIKNTDDDDLARKAEVLSSSTANLKMITQNNVHGNEVAKSIKPFYRRRVGKAYLEYTDYKKLNKVLAVSIPILSKLDALKIKVRANKNTSIKYSVYKPKLIENYSPHTCIFEGKIDVSESDYFKWITLPINIVSSNHYLLIRFEKNSNIDMAISGAPLPTTQMFTCEKNLVAKKLDYSTMEPMEWAYTRSPFCICYEPVPNQSVYSEKNIINGFNAPYGKPNMWLSKKDDETCNIILKWKKTISFNQIQLTFAPDITMRIHMQIFQPIMDLIAQEYVIKAKINNEYKIIKHIKENHKKVNKIPLPTTITDEIKIEFKKSTTNQIGIYEIRVY